MIKPEAQIDNHVERYISLALGVGFAVYDAYAQAHGIPFAMPAWLLGIIMYPYGENAWERAKDRVIDTVLKLPEVLSKPKQIEKKDEA